MWLGLTALMLAIVLVPATVVALDRVSPAPTVAQDRLGPVLLVPGYGGSTASLEVLGAQLRADGREVVLVDPPGNGTGDLREQAANLSRVVGGALRSSSADSVDLVGYSAGGVVVRWFLLNLGGAEVTRRVVTLASPHHGTDLAALASAVAGDACPEACRQLAPDSDLLLLLNRGDETPDGPLYTALWTEDDQTVVPPDSGRLQGALSYAVQDACPRLVVDHGDVPRTPDVVSMVEAALGVDPPALPDASACRG